MADYPVDSGVQITADPKILTPTAKAGNEEWLAEDITILLSNANRIAAIVVDFSYSVTSVVEYTLNAGDVTPVFVAFNQGNPLTGGQSRFIRVTTGVQLNFRATQAGNVNRCIVSIP